MTHDELLERIKNLNVSLIEDMSSDSLALLTEGFSEPLVRAIMCRTQDNYEQKKIFTKIKSSYKRWKKDTDFLWGPMPQMEVYPDYMDKMQLDVESGMIITEDGSIPAPPKKPFKAPYAPGLGSMFQEIYGKTHPASTDNPPIKEIVYNINTKKPAQTQETSQLQARIAELEAENASLRKQLEEERQKNQGIDDLPELDEVQKMNLHQKIVFFTTVTSVLLDKRYTNMRNLASFIASMCNEKPSTIAPMLSRIGQISDDKPNPTLSATLNSAAQCVSDLLLQILTDETRHDKSQIINKIRENLLLNYPSPEDK